MTTSSYLRPSIPREEEMRRTGSSLEVIKSIFLGYPSLDVDGSGYDAAITSVTMMFGETLKGLAKLVREQKITDNSPEGRIKTRALEQLSPAIDELCDAYTQIKRNHHSSPTSEKPLPIGMQERLVDCVDALYKKTRDGARVLSASNAIGYATEFAEKHRINRADIGFFAKEALAQYQAHIMLLSLAGLSQLSQTTAHQKYTFRQLKEASNVCLEALRVQERTDNLEPSRTKKRRRVRFNEMPYLEAYAKEHGIPSDCRDFFYRDVIFINSIQLDVRHLTDAVTLAKVPQRILHLKVDNQKSPLSGVYTLFDKSR